MTTTETSASQTAAATSKPRRVLGAISRWAFPATPLARVAMFRVMIYLFIIWDIFFLTNDVIPHGYAVEFYDPLWIGRHLPFPDPSVTGAIVMQWLLVLFCLVAASGWFPRIAGFGVAILFLAWMENSQGFSYVSHDHMALIVTTWLLPTIGKARFFDSRTSSAAGWALRVVQLATVATYFGSVFSKISTNGSFFAWPNSAVFTWAFMRRGTDLVTWTLQYPWLLKTAQWGLYLIEIFSPVVLFLRGKWLYCAVGVFFAFHAATFAALTIHFLPTVICWFAFLPLEKLLPWAKRTALRARGLRGSKAA